MEMITKRRLVLLLALFVLSGLFVAQAQDNLLNLRLVRDHIECDYDLNSEINYYRDFVTFDSPDFTNMLTIEDVIAGENSFVLYRYFVDEWGYPSPDNSVAIAELNLAETDDGVAYTITYMNQTSYPDFDYEIVTEGNLATFEGSVIDMQSITFIDQFAGDLKDCNWMGAFTHDHFYYLELKDGSKRTETIEATVYWISFYNLGLYTVSQVNEDADAKLKPNLLNVEYEQWNLSEEQEVKAYTVLRGVNSEPDTEISNMVHQDNGAYLETSNFLPDYYNEEVQYVVERYDTAAWITSSYGGYVSYVPIITVDGKDRVANDGKDNTYGSTISRYYIPGMNIVVGGDFSDHNSEDPFMWKDQNGEVCVYYNPYFDIEPLIHEGATWDLHPYYIRIWVESDNLRDCIVNDDGTIENDEEAALNHFLLISEENVGDYFDEWSEAYNDYAGVIPIGEPGSWRNSFGATLASKDKPFKFYIRMYCEVQANLPLKSGLPSWFPAYTMIESVVEWVPEPITTGVKEISSANELGKTYYNLQGMASDKPFSGVNIVVTRYADGTTQSTKIVH